jgi:IS30 family transposase
MPDKTIYVFFHMKGELKKLALEDLRLRGKGGKIPEMTLIDSRPVEINAREMPGHWEGDLIIGKGRKSAILVTVERKTRFIQMDLLESTDARTVRKKIEGRFKKLEGALRESITFDPGEENSEHDQLTENTPIAVYFCHPNVPCEKETCENTNYLIRDMLYPADDFRKLTQRDISRVVELLNGRPRKTLGFRTPYEAFSGLC